MTTNQPSGRARSSTVRSHGARQKSDRSGAAPRDLRGRLALAAAADSGRYPLIVGQAAPRTTSPLLNSDSSSDTAAQYFLTYGFWVLSRLTTASNCFCVSS